MRNWWRLGGAFDRGLLLSICIALIMAAPLLNDQYFFKAHDAPHSVFYLVEFDQAIRDGAWWPRWSTDFVFGYGYPVFNVYGPLSYFVAEVFVLLGLGYVGAVKAAYILAIIGAAAGMYLLGRRLYGPAAGVLASAVYVFIPYHVLDLYVRSAFAEFFAFVWLPVVLWALLRLEGEPPGYEQSEDRSRAPTVGAVAVAGGAVAALLLTHNATALIFLPLAALFVVWRLVEFVVSRRSAAQFGWLLVRYLGAGALAIGLSAAFWLPFVLESRYLKLDTFTSNQFDLSNNFVHVFQFFSPFWGFGYSGGGVNSTMSFQLGLSALVLGAFTLAGSPLRIPRQARRAAVFFALGSVALLVLTTAIAAPLWDAFPMAALVQFPWRLLAISALTLAALAGAAIAGLEARFTEPTAALRAATPLLFGVVVVSYPLLRAEPTPIKAENVTPVAVVNFELASYTATTIWAEYTPKTSPMVAQYQAGKPPEKWELAEGAGAVEQIRHAGRSDAAHVSTPDGGKLVYRTFDYPGWTIRIDGQTVEHYRVPPLALIGVDVPPGDHEVTARFEPTPPRLIGEGISGLSVLLALGMLVFRRRR